MFEDNFIVLHDFFIDEESTEFFVEDFHELNIKDELKWLGYFEHSIGVSKINYTGLYEERAEEKENIEIYFKSIFPWMEEDSPQWKFMEAQEKEEDSPQWKFMEAQEKEEDSPQWKFMEAQEKEENWNMYWVKLENKANKLFKKKDKLENYGLRTEKDVSDTSDEIIVLGNKFKSIRI